MLLWNRLHSYNAVHVGFISKPFHLKHLESILAGVLQHAGVSWLRVNGKKYFEYAPQPAEIKITILPPGADPLREEIQRQLNQVFDLNDGFTPFRFFVAPENEGFRLGLAYDHFVADADSISRLFTLIVRGYTGLLIPADIQPLKPYPPAGQSLSPRNLKYLPGWIISFPRLLADLLTTAKPRYGDKTDHENGLLLAEIPAEEFAQLHQLSKNWGVTLNELFLALLIQVLRPLSQKRLRGRRKNLSISSIFSYRKDLSPQSRDDFGLFLGSFRVHEPILAQRNLEELARAIHAQSQRVKRDKLYLAFGLELKVGLFVLSLCSPQRQQKLYCQHYPLWGGITNLNLNELAREEGQTISNYFRAVSTGPVCPLVLALTTYNNNLNIALSYRKTVYPPDVAAKVLGDFLQCVHMYTDIRASYQSVPQSVPSLCT